MKGVGGGLIHSFHFMAKFLAWYFGSDTPLFAV